MFRLELDTPVLTILRDKRHKDFSNSLLGIIESNLANDPVYFNCFPNFMVSLDDPHILKTLSLDITSQGLNFEEGVKKLTLVYKVTYKVLTTTMHQKTLLSSTKGKTMLIETNLNESSVCVPKLFSWDEITKNPCWVLDNAFISKKRKKRFPISLSILMEK